MTINVRSRIAVGRRVVVCMISHAAHGCMILAIALAVSQALQNDGRRGTHFGTLANREEREPHHSKACGTLVKANFRQLPLLIQALQFGDLKH